MSEDLRKIERRPSPGADEILPRKPLEGQMIESEPMPDEGEKLPRKPLDLEEIKHKPVPGADKPLVDPTKQIIKKIRYKPIE